MNGTLVAMGQHRTQSTYNSVYDCYDIREVVSSPANVEPNTSGLMGYIYPTFYSLWWSTNIFTDEFLDAARTFAFQSEHPQEYKSPPERQRQRIGIYITVSQQSNIVYLPLDNLKRLNKFSLLDQLREVYHEAVETFQSIRIVGPTGTVWFDHINFMHLPRRAGIMSHCKIVEAVATFYANTAQNSLSAQEANLTVLECMEKF